MQYGPTTEVNGRRFVPPPTETTSSGSIQPIADADRKLLPEGIRTDAKFAYYTKDCLNTTQDGTPSTLVFENVCYQVHDFRNWHAVGGFNRYVLVKRGR